MSLERDLQNLERARADVVRLLEGAGADALRRKPAPGRWSPLEIFEHLVLAERFVLRGLPDPEGMEPLRGVRRGVASRAIVASVLALGIRVPTPSEAMVPSGGSDLDVLKRKWNENEEWIRAFLGRASRSRLAEPLFWHPVAGALTFGEAVRLDRTHVRGHLRQIRKRL